MLLEWVLLLHFLKEDLEHRIFLGYFDHNFNHNFEEPQFTELQTLTISNCFQLLLAM